VPNGHRGSIAVRSRSGPREGYGQSSAKERPRARSLGSVCEGITGGRWISRRRFERALVPPICHFLSFVFSSGLGGNRFAAAGRLLAMHVRLVDTRMTSLADSACSAACPDISLSDENRLVRSRTCFR